MSSENQTKWSADGTQLPPIEPHTKVKHRVLESYVQNWIETLAGHGAHGVRTVTLVDGFCGGGMYRDGNQLWEGSSIRMIRRIEEGLRLVKERKPWHELDVEYLFIDSNPKHTKSLELQLRNNGFEHYLETGKCKILTGKFERHLAFCLNRVQQRRGYSFFFLDPFGIDIPPAITKAILGLGRSEVLLTHMLSGLVRIINGRDERYKGLFQNFEMEDYYKDLADQDDFLRRQAYLRNEGMALYRNEGGATYAHTFALMSNPKTVLYYLIHLSSNPTAISVMRNTTWLQNNLDFQFHYGVYGIGYRALDDIAKNLTIFDIDQRNSQFCLDKLREQVAQFVYNTEGLTLHELYTSTFQENPATQGLYISSLNQLQENGEIEVVREGRITRSKRLQKGDLLRRTAYKQYFLLDDKYNQKEIKPKKTRPSNQQSSNLAKESIIILPNYEQLDLLELE